MSARASDRKGEARLRAELAAAAEREAALARIARRINEQPLDVDGTLLEISEAARKLTGGDGGRVWLLDGERFTPTRGAMPDGPDEFVHQRSVVEASSDTPVARCVRQRTVAVDDLLELVLPGIPRENLLAARSRSTMAAPLGCGDAIAGALTVVRADVRPFDSTEMATLEAFAAQAAIAIETARAQQALAEGLERETSTAESCASSVDRRRHQARHARDRQARSARDADHAAIVFRRRMGTRNAAGTHLWLRGLGRRAEDSEQQHGWGPIEVGREPARRQRVTTTSALLVVHAIPSSMGLILVRRSTARSFHARHVALLEHFANQAVIAIENGRMFAEIEARNREVAEALRQQTATAEVLDVISRAPANLQAAFDAVVVKACQLLDSDAAIIVRRMRDGSGARIAVAIGGVIAAHSRLAAPTPAPIEAVTAAGGVGRAGTELHGGPDAIRDAAPELAQVWQAAGVNSSMVTALKTAAEPFGELVVSRRSPAPYTAAQVRLFETFASQAVIAIENARLFDEQASNSSCASVERERRCAHLQHQRVPLALTARCSPSRKRPGADPRQGARVFILGLSARQGRGRSATSLRLRTRQVLGAVERNTVAAPSANAAP
jgi:GAF domain-containing protein